MHERESKSLFSRGLPHILSNEQGERGKFTIFYPFLLKERRLHTHEAECTRSRCAFWFQVSDPGTIQGDLSRWSSSTNKVNNFKLCAFPHFSRQINLNRQSYILYFSSHRIDIFLEKTPKRSLRSGKSRNNFTEIPCKSREKFQAMRSHFSRQINLNRQNLIYFFS